VRLRKGPRHVGRPKGYGGCNGVKKGLNLRAGRPETEGVNVKGVQGDWGGRGELGGKRTLSSDGEEW